MKKYIWINWSNINHTKYPVRRAYFNYLDKFEFPVDRFNLTQNRLELTTKNIVKPAKFNLSNITVDFEDRYYSICDQVAGNVYETAGDRTIYLCYSGGIDSTLVLAALQRNSKYKEFVEQKRIVLAMTTGSIDEYPWLFFNNILPTLPIVVLDYDKLMCDKSALVVTGDMGDYITGSSHPLRLNGNSEFNLMSNYKDALKEYSNVPKLPLIYEDAIKHCPFAIESSNQFFWWISQCFSHQDNLILPYVWSSIKDISEIGTNNKVFRFFYDELFTTFSYEYMSTNPKYVNFSETRILPKKYIVNHFGDKTYMDKKKQFSQRKTVRILHKTSMYFDGKETVSTLDNEQV
jgi:hypothetical protein